MQSALNIVGSGFARLGIVAGILVFGVILGYSLLVFVIIAIQAFSAFGQ